MSEDTTTKRGRPSREAQEMKREVSRVPLAERNILSVRNKKPGLVYRWVNDIDDRISRFQLAGWELVTDEDLKIGDVTVNADKEVGGVISKKTGSDTVSYLMAIKEDFFKEDQKAKQDEVDEVEATIYRDLNTKRSEPGVKDYGSVKHSRFDDNIF